VIRATCDSNVQEQCAITVRDSDVDVSDVDSSKTRRDYLAIFGCSLGVRADQSPDLPRSGVLDTSIDHLDNRHSTPISTCLNLPSISTGLQFRLNKKQFTPRKMSQPAVESNGIRTRTVYSSSRRV
jgi:hypothetical protein